MVFISKDQKLKRILEAVYKISNIPPNQQKNQLKLDVLRALAECFDYRHTVFWDVSKDDLHEAPIYLNVEECTLNDYLATYKYYDPLHPSNMQNQPAIQLMQHNTDISSDTRTFYTESFLRSNSYKDEMVMYLYDHTMPTAAIGFLRKHGEGYFTHHDVWALSYLKKTIENLYLLHQYVEPKKLLHITAREEELLHYVCKGYRNAEIAKRLYVSENTVKKHLQNLYRKLQVTSKTQLAMKYSRYSMPYSDWSNEKA